MPATGPIGSLELRKAELLRRSGENRAAIREAAPALKQAAAWVDFGLEAGRKARATWEVLSPWLGSPAAAAPDGTRSGVVSKLRRGLAILRTVRALWRGNR
jgi:hypothetical protein